MAGSAKELTAALSNTSSVERITTSVFAPIRGIAFWAAIALPFLHMPLLYASELSSQNTTTAFVALLALNVVAILIGHPYSRD